jgi:hypothetical protein
MYPVLCPDMMSALQALLSDDTILALSGTCQSMLRDLKSQRETIILRRRRLVDVRAYVTSHEVDVEAADDDMVVVNVRDALLLTQTQRSSLCSFTLIILRNIKVWCLVTPIRSKTNVLLDDSVDTSLSGEWFKNTMGVTGDPVNDLLSDLLIHVPWPISQRSADEIGILSEEEKIKWDALLVIANSTKTDIGTIVNMSPFDRWLLSHRRKS